jgi:hypothetical protein
MATVSDPAADDRPPLFVIRGDASAEEVAALTAVLQAMAAAGAAARDADRDTGRKPRPEWSAPRRGLRRSLPHGPGAWRGSALPG